MDQISILSSTKRSVVRTPALAQVQVSKGAGLPGRLA